MLMADRPRRTRGAVKNVDGCSLALDTHASLNCSESAQLCVYIIIIIIIITMIIIIITMIIIIIIIRLLL